MPVNEPYKDRSIVPSALAFPSGGGGGAVSNVPSYQDELGERVTITNTTIVADTNYVERRLGATAVGIVDAERRAKHWVGDYHRAFEWDIQTSCVISTNAWDPVQYDHECARTMGAEFNGTVTTADAEWRYVVPEGAEGWYYVHAMTLYTLTAGMNVAWASLALFVNGIQWRVIDRIDNGYAGENPIIDCKLSGGCLVPLHIGAVLTVRTFINSPITGDQTLTAPASCYGYVSGLRVRCDNLSQYGEGARIDGPITGNGYVFTT